MVAPTTSQVEPGSAITIEPLLYGVAAEISLAIFYIANMVSIEFIKVICSIEKKASLLDWSVKTEHRPSNETRDQDQLEGLSDLTWTTSTAAEIDLDCGMTTPKSERRRE